MLSKRSLWLFWQTCRSSTQPSAWKVGGNVLGGLLILYLIGPLPFIRLWEAKDQPQGQDERDGCQSVGEGVFWLVLSYSALLYLRQPITWLWSDLFATLAEWTHLPALVWFGNETFWPPTLENLLFRWLVTWPLASLVASILVMEDRSPDAPVVRRVLTPQEQQAVLVEKPNQSAKRHRIAKAKYTGETSASRTSPSSPARSYKPFIPSPTSLWGRVDWSQVPDGHPLKQEVMATLHRLPVPSEAEQNDQTEVQALAAEPSVPETRALTAAPVSHSRPHAPETEEDDDWDAHKSVLRL